MLRFRDEGFSIYDLGGWYQGKDSQDQLRINCFKERFGGELVLQYNCDEPITRKGEFALWMRAAAQRLLQIPYRPFKVAAYQRSSML